MAISEEYYICKRRGGHVSIGTITGWENYTEYQCKFCGVHYTIKPAEQVEINPPQLAQQNDMSPEARNTIKNAIKKEGG